MASSQRLKRPQQDDFEQVRQQKKIKISWPTRLVQQITGRITEGVTDTRSLSFLRQAVNLLYAGGIDTSWHLHRFLGSGGFGTVAMWAKKDEEGTTLDEIAIKEGRDIGFVAFDADNPNILDRNFSSEAQILLTIDRVSDSPESKSVVVIGHQGCPSCSEADTWTDILHLRKFATFMRFRIPYDDTSYQIQLKPQVWRYYLEHVPYGDLGGLMLRYRAFNRYLPELFL